MNEEFGTLKDMIPACKGQDMHKLAILQVCPDFNLRRPLSLSRSLTVPDGLGKH